MAFQVLVGRQVGIGEACLILTERRPASGYPIVEAFLVLPKSRNCYRAKVFRLHRLDFDVAPEVLRAVDLIRVAREKVEQDLNEELITWWQAQTPGTPLPDPVRFSEGDRGSMLSLWLRQACPDSFRAMERQTRDTELTQFIRELVYIPTLAEHPLD